MVDCVAIQGEAGSFSHAAALETHGPALELVPCPTFGELFRAVENGQATSGIVPIENTLARAVPESYGRVLVVGREPAQSEPGTANKTSLMVALGNTPGTLYRGLGVFAARGLNLTKIESRPLPGRPWEYLFYLDVVDSGQGIAAALEELGAFTSGIRILGTYPAR